MTDHVETDLHANFHAFNASFWWSIGLVVVAAIHVQALFKEVAKEYVKIGR